MYPSAQGMSVSYLQAIAESGCWLTADNSPAVWMMLTAFLLTLLTYFVWLVYLRRMPRPLWTVKGYVAELLPCSCPAFACLHPVSHVSLRRHQPHPRRPASLSNEPRLIVPVFPARALPSLCSADPRVHPQPTQ